MSKARDLADFISTGSILSDGTIESTEISGVTADATEINKLDGLTADTTELNTLDGVTATTAELNKLAGTTATTSDFDKLSNVTASATELNYMTGATSSIQSQLDNISVTSGSLTKTFTNGESATITLAQSITPAPVVSVTKEVAQTGQSSKGAWDVNATASNYDLHNTAYATTLTPSSYISGATYNQAAAHDSQDLNPMGFDFKPDGTAYYVAGLDGDDITQWSVSTAWDLSTASGLQVFDISGYDSNVRGVLFNTDGTKMFILGRASQRVWPFALSTAWDISTASIINSGNTYIDFGTSSPNLGQTTEGFAFNDDGTKLYINDNGASNQSVVYQWDLTTAFDLSTASYANKSFSFHNDSKNIRSLFVDGDTVYIYNETDEYIYTYSFGTSGDISTLSATGVSFDVSADTLNNRGIYVETTQNKLYLLDSGTVDLHEYDLTTTLQVALGTGSFASTDVGKRIQGNGGDVILTSTAGAYDTTDGSAFTDSSTIASGSWTMHGLKSAGDADGLTLSNYVVGYGDVNTYTNDSVSFNYSGQISVDSAAFYIRPDGTKLYFIKQATNRVYQYTLSTAWDITTASYNYDIGLGTAQGSDSLGITFSPDGTKMFIPNLGFDYLVAYNLSTAWDVNTASVYNSIDMSSATYGSNNNPADLVFNNDGTRLFVTSTANNKITQLNLQNGYTLISNQVSLGYNLDVSSQTTSPCGVAFNSDGTKMFVSSYISNSIFQYSLSQAFELSTASYDNKTLSLSSIDSEIRSIFFKDGGQKIYIQGGSNDTIFQFSSGSAYLPTSQYHIGVTNASGQIDSSFWTDINSMTADQSLGDGEAYYAVSTDYRTTWSVAKGSDGVRPIVRDNAGTWQYNTASVTSGFGIADASYDSKSFSVATQDAAPRGMAFNNDGTKMYIGGDSNDEIFEYVLSTANDISTASYNSVSLSIGSQDAAIQGITFNNDGTQLYMLGSGTDSAFQYTLTTAFDLSTASYASKSLSVATQDAVPRGIAFKPDGTKMYIVGGGNLSIFQYSLSTADDLSTASYDSVSFAITGITSLSSMAFNNDGTKMFVYGYASGDALQQYSLSTAYDISTASYDSVSFSPLDQDGNVQSIEFSADGTKMFASGDATNTIYQYSTESVGYTTSTTWTNATTNDEFYALQQALGATSVNRMDKTQLDAVADGSHFTLGNTLDLMIALKQDTASASLPTSDGVAINYDAEALNQGAVLGTDYDFDFPANNKVRITSNAAQNLKIRVV